MMKTFTILTLVAAFATATFGQDKVQDQTQQKSKQTSDETKSESPAVAETETAAVPAALNFTMKSLDGQDVELSKYAGKVVVFVNTASKCGMTPQYKQLQELHEKYAGKGLAIVGVPCNQIGKQEPGTAAEIATFCEKNYGVEFDMLAKIDVNGENQADLYKHLNSLDAKPKGAGDVRWNFEKFVLDRNGLVIARFGSRTKPDSDEFVKVIEGALGN